MFKIIDDVKNKERYDLLKVGATVLLRGDVVDDKYDREISLKPYDIMIVEKIPKMDEAPQKRVELHCHSKMSSMDSVAEVSDIVNTAARWGHPGRCHHRPRRRPGIPRRGRGAGRRPQEGEQPQADLRGRGLFCQRLRKRRPRLRQPFPPGRVHRLRRRDHRLKRRFRAADRNRRGPPGEWGSEGLL